MQIQKPVLADQELELFLLFVKLFKLKFGIFY